MHLIIKFILFYKALGFFIAFVLSCSPDDTLNYIPISISTSASPIHRLNIRGYSATPGKNIIVYSNGKLPAFNEIFALTQPKNGIYEFRSFEDFNLAIESAGNEFKINTSGDKNIEKFHIECDFCEPKKNSTDWIQYYSSCSIKNIASGLCMNNDGGNNEHVRQVDCAIASKWVIWGRASISLTCPNCPKRPVCSTCPTCPECPTCPTCPEYPACPECPTCPTCPTPVCPTCPTPVCPKYPVCPDYSNFSTYSLAAIIIAFVLGMILPTLNRPTGYNPIK